MSIKAIVMGIFLSAVAFNTFAVDGYKNVKFGSDISTLKKAKLCTWAKGDSYSIKGVDTYFCPDFKFSGSNSMAIAIFINDRFERISINLNNNDIEPLLTALQKKYGEPSSATSADKAEKAVENGGEVYIKYDSDTVFVSMNRDLELQKDLASLVYSSSDYTKKFAAVRSKTLEDDV